LRRGFGGPPHRDRAANINKIVREFSIVRNFSD
jgi:hypothetical protein